MGNRFDLELLRHRLRARPGSDPGHPAGCAAVALIISLNPEPSLLLIRRAERAGDPWSGHVAFPGGRWEPGDATLVETAAREAEEEVGIPRVELGDPIGTLGTVIPFGGVRTTLPVLPTVFEIPSPAPTRPNREVAATVWAPIRQILDPASRGSYRHVSEGGAWTRLPSVMVEGMTVWGLTHRILWQFLELGTASP